MIVVGMGDSMEEYAVFRQIYAALRQVGHLIRELVIAPNLLLIMADLHRPLKYYLDGCGKFGTREYQR